MSRVLEALKTIESRRQLAAEPASYVASRAAVETSWPSEPETIDQARDDAGFVWQPVPEASTCLLPTAEVVPDEYLDLARGIFEQLSETYSNVLLVAGADHFARLHFSLPTLARALALQSSGKVLLIDGDLRAGGLSQSVGSIAPGMIEVVQGEAIWGGVIHATDAADVDFVPCGAGEIPTFDRPEFGWQALRPLYRVVLIGVADAREPETAWLAARCDATYFLLSRPHTTRRAAIDALEGLRGKGANVLGGVVIGD